MIKLLCLLRNERDTVDFKCFASKFKHVLGIRMFHVLIDFIFPEKLNLLFRNKQMQIMALIPIHFPTRIYY